MTALGRLRSAVSTALVRALNRRPGIVLCHKSADLPHWRTLLAQAGSEVLVVALDDPELTRLRTVTGAATHLELFHDVIADLTCTDPANRVVYEFDPGGRAVLLTPDPLDPPQTGTRDRLGAKTAGWALVEDKMLIDPLWDLAGVPRENSLVCDLAPDFPLVAAAMNTGAGIVASCQEHGRGPRAGGEGIWWSRTGTLPTGFPAAGTTDTRVRVMPLLEGLPCRAHGIVTDQGVSSFPPLELLSLPRPRTGTFLWSGAIPLTNDDPEVRSALETACRRTGRWLQSSLGYRGAFAIDGILTTAGYRPTELTTRLTSAFESAEPDVRVLLSAANLLTRSSHDVNADDELTTVATTALTRRTTIDVYGASPHARVTGTVEHGLRWTAGGPVINNGPAQHGRLTLTRSPRGRLLHASLNVADLPGQGPVGELAPALFALSDAVFGTDFGQVTAPFGLTTRFPTPMPAARSPVNIEPTLQHRHW